ncbi:hypothetical protein EBR57_07550, partial [bacterium]|nr:hypothetical protein [bacterium]
SATESVNVDYFDFTRAYYAHGFGMPETYKGVRVAKPITIKMGDIRFKIIPGINLISENIFSGESTQRLGISLEFDSEHRWGDNTSIISGLNFISDGYCSGISYFVGGKGYIN